MTPLTRVRTSPVLAMLAGVIGLLGFVNASVYPYQSLIGIEVLGLSKPAFALVLVLASAVAVTTSVFIGILSDQRANRRRVALTTALIGLLGSALMLILPHAATFVLANGILLPIASSLFGQAFALTRLATHDIPDQRDGVQAAIRAAMSVAFLAMLVFWTYAFGLGLPVLSIYASGGLAAFGLVLLIALRWPQDGRTTWHDAPSGLRMGQALRQLARPAVSVRLLCLGAVASSGILYMVLVSLVFEAEPTRSTADVALYFGLVAGWEVPAMLFLPRYLAHIPRSRLIIIGTALYVCHLAMLPILAGSSALWVMTLAAGVGGTAMLILPISYYQDLMATQPGTAASLMALQKLVGDSFAAAAFTIGTSLGGYVLTAFIGAGIAMAGALGLWLVDRRAPFMPSS